MVPIFFGNGSPTVQPLMNGFLQEHFFEIFCDLTVFCFCAGPGIIVELARANRFSATLTAKALLVDHLTETSGEGKPPTKQQVSALMRDTNLIEDSDVAVEVLKATLSDESYGYLRINTENSVA